MHGPGDNGLSIYNHSDTTPRMFFSELGNIGIGTAFPVSTLHISDGVYGGIDSTVSELQIEDNDHVAFALNSPSDMYGSIYFRDSDDVSNSASGFIRYRHDADDMVFRTASSDRLTISSSGKVGIGTMDPWEFLHVNGNSGSTYMRVEDTAENSYAGLKLANDARTWFVRIENNDRFQIRDQTVATNPFTIEGAAPSNSMWIGSNGYVGIGRNNPEGQLHISNLEDALVILEADSDNTVGGEDQNPRLELRQDGGAVIGALGFEAGANLIYVDSLENSLYLVNDKAGPLQLGTDNKARLTIDANGYIGVRTTSPSHILTVNGVACSEHSAWDTFSDIRLKDVSGFYQYGLDEISRLNPIQFSYKEDNPLNLSTDEEQVGISAQELEEIIPEAVTIQEDGYRTVNNDPVVWAMVNAIKELKSENDELRARIEAIEGRE